MDTVCVPDSAVPIIIALQDVFLHLQRKRLEGWAASVDNSLSSWSELYRSQVVPLGDDLVNRIWGLISTILQILENDGSLNVNASTAVVAWYWNNMLDEDYIKEKIMVLHGEDFDDFSDNEIEEIGMFYLDMIERTFFSGKFLVTFSLIDALMGALRGRGENDSENPFSVEIEECMADVQRLLSSSFSDPDSFEEWRSNANQQVYVARRVLGDVNSNTDPSARKLIAQSLCAVSLNILLIISGDSQLIQERCIECGYTFVDYITALCAIIKPFCTLSELRDAVETSVDTWTGRGVEVEWDFVIIREVFKAANVEDIVYAMQAICTEVVTRISWDPLEMDGDDVASEEEGDDDQEECEAVSLPQAGTPSTRYFALLSITAHLADLCAPALVAFPDQIELTFIRNNLITSYVKLFAYNPRTWKIAGTYLAHLALLNPQELRHLVLYAARWAAVEHRFYHSLVAFCHTMWDSSCPHQTVMRRQLKDKLGEHPTVQQWLDALDFERLSTMKNVHHTIIAKRIELHDIVTVAWYAVETDTPHLLEFKLKQLLRAPTALADDQLCSVGAAVHNSFIQLDTCTTVEMAHSLLVCAGIFTYRRAAEASKAARLALVQSPEATLERQRLSAECIDKIGIALRRINTCDFAFHPLTIINLVEHAVDLLISMQKEVLGMNLPPCVQLAGRILPSLLRDLSTSCVHHGQSLSKELLHRSNIVREKLVCTLEMLPE
ncbi:unnamed protein product [Phytomonas sp. Hart1]|nr:unnamed protein product [Phytomonas sp. Hart1]|eukprot:CCW69384.1 unnamed protein product [Phytomonas sp. isolate Hart1]